MNSQTFTILVNTNTSKLQANTTPPSPAATASSSSNLTTPHSYNRRPEFFPPPPQPPPLPLQTPLQDNSTADDANLQNSTEIKSNEESMGGNSQQIDFNDTQNADNYDDINDNELNQTSVVRPSRRD